MYLFFCISKRHEIDTKRYEIHTKRHETDAKKRKDTIPTQRYTQTPYRETKLCCQVSERRGGGLGSRPKKMYGERLGDGVEYHLMKPTPRR